MKAKKKKQKKNKRNQKKKTQKFLVKTLNVNKSRDSAKQKKYKEIQRNTKKYKEIQRNKLALLMHAILYTYFIHTNTAKHTNYKITKFTTTQASSCLVLSCLLSWF